MDLLCLSNLSKEEILTGSFGLEWESLRVHKNGKLALSAHPEIFGDKLKNPMVTTDFSESQVEMITPTFETIDEAFDVFAILADLVNTSLPNDEYLWFQSLPCILPSDDKIPIAKYSDEGISSQEYREALARKYGLKKQMISGIHFNFSFSDDVLKKLHKIADSDLSFRRFKDEVYLKISRNYLRYCWMIIYLTGCSVGAHSSFTSQCLDLMDSRDVYGSYYSTKGVSFRNASCGYKNLKKLYPSYVNVDEFTRDIQSFIDSGDLSEAKELYTQVRLKPKNPADYLNSLSEDGIQYIEIRTLDINPFYKCGLIKRDMKFLQLFLIYMLVKKESDYPDWQKEAFINEELTAESAYDDGLRLLRDGEEVTLQSWAAEIINEMYGMCDVFYIDEYETLKIMHDRILNPDLTYGRRLLKLIEERGFINTNTMLSLANKNSSKDCIKTDDPKLRKLYEKYSSIVFVDDV
ncbi:MAG: glutamate--cysteine ligase [Methanobrevibacter sp.]|nr:glutamate--cysteine ligase [Methanobrevibacter sp.]